MSLLRLVLSQGTLVQGHVLADTTDGEVDTLRGHNLVRHLHVMEQLLAVLGAQAAVLADTRVDLLVVRVDQVPGED